ncbi:MAG: hypothetical protein LUH14_12175 [Clostridiaceae bacterium]|nr:hypothetical protein [Clostridiaceae bacterium]
MLTGLLLAKGMSDLTFGGAFLWYLVKYIVYAAVALCAVFLGIRLRKKKNEKQEAASESEEQ